MIRACALVECCEEFDDAPSHGKRRFCCLTHMHRHYRRIQRAARRSAAVPAIKVVSATCEYGHLKRSSSCGPCRHVRKVARESGTTFGAIISKYRGDRLCRCGCKRSIEPGRSLAAEYRLECKRALDTASRADRADARAHRSRHAQPSRARGSIAADEAMWLEEVSRDAVNMKWLFNLMARV